MERHIEPQYSNPTIMREAGTEHTIMKRIELKDLRQINNHRAFMYFTYIFVQLAVERLKRY